MNNPIEVTKDECAKFLSKLRVYTTKPQKDILRHKIILGYEDNGNIISGETVAEVHYYDNIHKTYYIDKIAASR